MNISKTVSVGLIVGRHDMPVDSFIINAEINPLDFQAIRQAVGEFLSATCPSIITSNPSFTCNYASYTDESFYSSRVALRVFVTGLTPVTAELIRQCAIRGIKLTLMHFNRETGEYNPQEIF